MSTTTSPTIPQGQPMDTYLVSLCEEYVSLVDAMRDGQHTTEEIRQLDSQRLVTHDELCRYTNKDKSFDMYAYAKTVLHASRGGNIQ
ncbi:MAG: hypothetical protein GFH27_549283n398 [Chloroflexi bacterium AL-W]|nr:hypothetical protein [Chloroflexi bacterium AL-N1]NOK64481.1 hypothetical protein [Chloroflexi bacterium AL-N10]NOK75723.1 hypothetical protein [Chloroflexi bacterium AL-N5]NOK80519.1 hypothetical protein [Chloroflexi bacterium AL-W]NOK87033.1 hypothetical protein [Chloroflexi bacterium AL-N15]